MEYSLPQQNDFSSLSIEEKVINIKRRISEMQLRLRLQNTSKSARPDPMFEHERTLDLNEKSQATSHTSTSKNQYASAPNDLKAKLLKHTQQK